MSCRFYCQQFQISPLFFACKLRIYRKKKNSYIFGIDLKSCLVVRRYQLYFKVCWVFFRDGHFGSFCDVWMIDVFQFSFWEFSAPFSNSLRLMIECVVLIMSQREIAQETSFRDIKIYCRLCDRNQSNLNAEIKVYFKYIASCNLHVL